MLLTFRPIKQWPEGWPRTSPKWTPFKASYSSTLKLLDRELEALGTRSAMLQVDASERDVRLDGQLRGDAKVGNQGVILTIDTAQHGTLVYACDEFENERGGTHWHENLRAIALGLEALRKVERYGIANRGQQYAGYRELPSGIALGRAMSFEEAARFVARQAWPDAEIDEQEVIDDLDTAFRAAAKRLHPDQGGDPDLFRKLTEARDIIEKVNAHA